MDYKIKLDKITNAFNDNTISIEDAEKQVIVLRKSLITEYKAAIKSVRKIKYPIYETIDKTIGTLEINNAGLFLNHIRGVDEIQLAMQDAFYADRIDFASAIYDQLIRVDNKSLKHRVSIVFANLFKDTELFDLMIKVDELKMLLSNADHFLEVLNSHKKRLANAKTEKED